ncbi:uncharacterized protein E0L32_005309 [Thyridium curvatum]|uniref:Uncharacterized protein n=1 Tax=Thyridium curvatum TaxID=1093900 RepID=A0A507B4E7_9PEZI|nr:uncharacterized protein E0L32_005309 [Thyridium curvatum]TPX14617.1 hypothetical protein E0L32_005309 [Thyridium curvatum]
MRYSVIPILLGALGLFKASLAQSTFPPEPEGLTEILSQRWPGASITYKQTSICETTTGVKAWSGYVHLPPSVLNKVPDMSVTYDVNLFFWYFEARNNARTAPTSIYLGGGPGYTSFDPMSGFPCNINKDSNSTTLNPFSWNTDVNMLYIDQPVGAGFSYSVRQNGTLNLLQRAQNRGPLFSPLQNGEPLPKTNATLLAATLDSRTLETTQNTTTQAARTLWQFAQVWFQDKLTYSVQYGGFWSTAFFSYVVDQNKLISSQQHKVANATALRLGTLGIGNGCIDIEAQAASFPQMAWNNTYGVQSYPEEVYDLVMGNLTAPEIGCYDRVKQCRKARADGDPTSQGNNNTVNEACMAASTVCFDVVMGSYNAVSNRSTFDILHLRTAGDEPIYFEGFFNQRWVQKDLGVRVNFTSTDYSYPAAVFGLTGAAMIQDKSLLENVLDNGFSVALVYGDRDYECNWIGVENISLTVNYPSASAFRSAGYADIVTNSSYNGGLVRQHGNVSFSRVFDAGHAVAAYQPETVYQIFQRSMFGKDVATGKIVADQGYSSNGSPSTWARKNKVPEVTDANMCYSQVPTDTCTDEQLQALADGTAVVKDFIVQSPLGARLDPITGAVIPVMASGSGNGNGTSGNGHSSGASVSLVGSFRLAVAIGSALVWCLA